MKKSIKDSKELFNNIDRHFECFDESEDYRNATHKLEKGRKLYLEVEVEESEMTHWLFKWLYSSDENEKSLIPFGCKLNTIHFGDMMEEQFKQKLIDLANSL